MEPCGCPDTNEKSRVEIENKIGTSKLVVASINHILQQPVSPCSSNGTIFKVLEPLRSINPKAYTPVVISIGPFHSGRKDLEANPLKPMYLRHFLDLSHLSLSMIVETFQTLEQRARCCYTESIEMSSDEFVELLVFDACFVVMHLICWTYRGLNPQNEENLWQVTNEIFCDLMMIENQLPFFLLRSLYDLFASSQPLLRSKSFIEIVQNYFSANEMPWLFFIDIQQHSANNLNHFIDLVRVQRSVNNLNHFIDLVRVRKTHTLFRNMFIVWPPSATELHECGVIFMIGDHIKFNDQDGCLQLPSINIDTNFEKYVRNIIAYEQHHIDFRLWNKVTNFALFMTYLVQTDQDVKLLIKGGIIENYLGSIKEVTQLFNNLGKYTYIGINYYNSDCHKMKVHCKRRRHRWMTSLWRNYFSTP